MSALRLLDADGLPGRLALSPEEAAAAIGISRDTFDRHVLPELRVARIGSRRVIPVRALNAWLEDHAEGVLEPRR